MAKKKKRAAQSAAALQRNGLKAFKNSDYGRAIDAWERASETLPDRAPRAPLAEAYFRRGQRREDLDQALADVKQAVDLQPDDALYVYHLGLVEHRRGDLDAAVAAYQLARRRASDALAQRVAYPLALAWLEQGEDVAETAVWNELPDDTKIALQQVSSFQRRPYEVDDDAGPLWHGLAAYDSGRYDDARTHLTQLLDKTPQTAGIARFYLGAIAAQEEDWAEAAHHWSAAHAAGFNSDRLRDNLGEAYHRLAEERLENEQVAVALAAATEADRYKDDDNQLNLLIAHARQHQAYRAASEGDWETARQQWEAAEARAGGDFRLACNLALAHEQAEDYVAAAERWREALRRRPRRDDHPDAVSDDEVARLWQRAAEAYNRAGEFDEAVYVYRQAVKYNPDNLALRMDLAESMLTNGQFQAAENELNRILDRNGDYIPALLLMGEVVAQSGYWWQNQPVRYWERVLELKPNHEEAQQHLVDYYVNRGEDSLEWLGYFGDFERTIDYFEKALHYDPQNADALIGLAQTYLLQDDVEQGAQYIDQALQRHPTKLDVYERAIGCWYMVDEPEDAWEIGERAETAVANIPPLFFVNIASNCFYNGRPDFADPWLNKAVAIAPPDMPVHALIGEMAAFIPGAEDVARYHLEQSIEKEQVRGQAYLMLGIVAARSDDLDTANIHWSKSERIARQERDEALKERIAHARGIFDSPFGRFGRLLDRGAGSELPFPPDFFEDVIDELYEEDDDYF